MVIHAAGEVAGVLLRLQNRAHAAADVARVAAEVRILTAGEESHHADAIHTGSVIATGPTAFLTLLGGEPFEAALINRLHLMRHLRAETQLRGRQRHRAADQQQREKGAQAWKR